MPCLLNIKRHGIKNLKINLYELKPFPGDARQFITRYDTLMAERNLVADAELTENENIAPIINDLPRFGLHAKSIVVDSRIAIIGSHNLTPRSVTMNTENVVIIWDEKVAKALEENILRDTEPQNSWVITKQKKTPFISHFSGLIGSISQMLPVFDIWPFRYTGSFQLKEGMESLPPSHQDFYEHYENVGQFPEVDMSSKSIQTRLFKSFGGFTAPLM